MKLDKKFVLPPRKTKAIKVRVLSNTLEDKDSIIPYLHEVAPIDGAIRRIKPDTAKDVDHDTVYVLTDNVDTDMYPERFIQKAIPLKQFTYLAYEGRL